MKAKSPKSNLLGSVTGQATAEATLTNNSEMILHSSENRRIPVQKSDVRLVESVESKDITRIVLADGREAFVQETAHHIFEILRD
jgi:hypothetical protein